MPYPCSNAEYEELMSAAMHRALADGITHIAFGDLFLEDIRAYRVEKLDQVGMGALFPLWQRPTRALAEEMIAGGLVAHLTAVDPRQLDPSFVGRTFDRTLLDDLPPSVDPCGENGEFHTFVTQAPCFRRPIDVSVGQRVERDGFWLATVRSAVPRSTAISRLLKPSHTNQATWCSAEESRTSISGRGGISQRMDNKRSPP